jgi:hypothetical protein
MVLELLLKSEKEWEKELESLKVSKDTYNIKLFPM